MILKDQVIMVVDQPNHNNRIYSADCIQKEVDRLQGKELYGQIGMPETPTIHLIDVTHKVSNLRMEQNKLIGDITIVDFPDGNPLKHLIENTNVCFRSAGLGNISENEDPNGAYLVTNFTLTGVHAVLEQDAS